MKRISLMGWLRACGVYSRLTAGLLLTLCSVSGLAATRYVAVDDKNCGGSSPCYQNLQNAVDAAADGDTLLIAKGVYQGSMMQTSSLTGYQYKQVVFVEGKGLTLKGGYVSGQWASADPENNPTIIDAQGSGRAITVLGDSSELKTITLQGLQLINGDYTGLGNAEGQSNHGCDNSSSACGGGLLAYQVSLNLIDMTLRDNVDGRAGAYPKGGGAYLWAVHAVQIKDSRFFNNTSGYEGGGLYIYEPQDDVSIENSLFDANYCWSAGCGLHYFNGDGNLSIVDSRFVANKAQNTSHTTGAGLWLAVTGPKAELKNLEIRDNDALKASGMYLRKAGDDAVDIMLQNLMVVGNSGAVGSNGAVHFDNWGGVTHLAAKHITVAGNSTPAAIHLYAYGSDSEYAFDASFSNTLISGGTYGFVGDEDTLGSFNIAYSNTLFADASIIKAFASNGNPVFSGANDIVGDPKLNDLYRLQSGSAAIDAGKDVQVSKDIDGDARPSGSAVDIGADEYRTGEDGIYRFSQSGYPVQEGGTVGVTVERIGADLGATSVRYATRHGTADASDYTAASGLLQFAAGETQKTISVVTTDDAVFEPTETIYISLSDPAAGTALGMPATATISVQDNDANPAGSLVFAASNWTVTEAAGAKVTVQVLRQGGSTGTISVDYATGDAGQGHDAGSDVDYHSTSGTLTFNDGEISKSFDVILIDDSTAENDEFIGLELSNPTGGADLGSPHNATITIEDDDGNTVELGFKGNSASVKEGDGTVTVNVELAESWNQAVTVDYASSNGSATAPGDFTAVSGSLSFAPGETSKPIVVSIVDDGAAETLENFHIDLSNASAGVVLKNSRITVSIYDQSCAAGTADFTVQAPHSYSGSFYCRASRSVKAGDLNNSHNGLVDISAGDWVMYSAPKVELKPGFRVQRGGSFSAGNGIQP